MEECYPAFAKPLKYFSKILIIVTGIPESSNFEEAKGRLQKKRGEEARGRSEGKKRGGSPCFLLQGKSIQSIYIMYSL
jgi:hypothetical protein